MEVGAGERVKMLEVEAELSINSESLWKVRGGCGRERRGDGRKDRLLAFMHLSGLIHEMGPMPFAS